MKFGGFINNTHSFINTIQISFLATILLAEGVRATEDNYLDALHDEASNLEYLDETRPGNTVSVRKKSLSPEVKRALTSISNFETYFRQKDSASVAIYFRLDLQERMRIYHRFKSTGSFDTARRMAIDLYNLQK